MSALPVQNKIPTPLPISEKQGELASRLNLKQALETLNAPHHPREVTQRFVLYVGFKCNLRCQFCYYLKSIENGTAKNDKYEDLAKKIKQAHAIGKTEIDFTGGEATLHPDFPKLLALCVELGFETINVISNGWKLANKDAFKRFVDAGLNEALFSLHSYDESVHDGLTQMPKSHSRILQAIANAHELGIRVRLNTVVNKINYGDLNSHLNFLKSLRPYDVNLIVFNPTEETVGYKGHGEVRFGSYEEIGAAIGEALRQHQADFNLINVRFLPFCFAKGFESNIRTYWQEIYEKQEWDPVLHWAFRKNWFFVVGAAALGFVISPFVRSHVRSGRKSLYTRFSEYFQLMRVTYLFQHKPKCKTCKLNRICPGLPRDFNRVYPNTEVHPYSENETPDIINPALFGYKEPRMFAMIAKAIAKK